MSSRIRRARDEELDQIEDEIDEVLKLELGKLERGETRLCRTSNCIAASCAFDRLSKKSASGGHNYFMIVAPETDQPMAGYADVHSPKPNLISVRVGFV